MRKKILSLMAGAVVAGSLMASAVGAIPAPANGKGDINGDRRVDVRDVQMLLQYLVGRITLTPTQMNAADIAPRGKADGKVQLNDAMILQRLVVGLDKF